MDPGRGRLPEPVPLSPYSPPVADRPLRTRSVLGRDDVVTPRIMAAMRQTRPWVTFMAVLGFIGTGLMVLGGIAFMLTAPTGMPGGPAIGLVYLVVAALYGAGATLLHRYRSSIASMERGCGIDALENALEHQKSFWRFVGITAAATLGLYGLVFVGVMVLGAAM